MCSLIAMEKKVSSVSQVTIPWFIDLISVASENQATFVSILKIVV